ncbi:MAG: hypothetical protein F4X08_11035 [Gemmatimonadetes bacterium]|nr:hypothetical protein [Gemmatimonadota bacterium]MYD26333.1 hypothetical protein [Gemmatimonadota bacterium]
MSTDSNQVSPSNQTVNGLTPRVLILGSALAVFIAIWTPHTNYVMHGPRLTLSHLSIAALVSFLVVIFCVQIPLRRWRPERAFSAGELAVLFVFCLVSSTIPGKAFVDYFVGILASPFYYATPENRWADTFFPHLPGWLVVRDDLGAATGFYEGASQSVLLWVDWIVPLFWWMCMLAALFLVMACIAVIFRRQWVEHERLSFPAVQIPSMLIAGTTRGGIMPAFMANRYFQVGFGVTFALLAWNCLAYFGYVPAIPVGAPFRTQIQLAQSVPETQVQFNLFMMCFAYFADLKVLFSIWFFHLLALLEISLLNQLGVSASGMAGGSGFIVKTQHFGGFWVFVLWGLWIGRHHLKAVWRKALGRAPELDDSMELLSYRTALLGLAGGLCYLLFWLNRMGMSVDVAVLFLAITLALYIGVTRIVAETGLVFLDLPVNSNEMTVGVIGSTNLSPSNLTALGLTHAVSHNHRGIGLSSLIHGLKVSEGFTRSRKGLFAAVGAVLVLTFIVTNGYTIYAGASGTGAHDFAPLRAEGFYDQLATWFNNPYTLSYEEIYFLLLGAGITTGLLFMQYRFPGWPFHPIGYVVAYADIINFEITSIFTIWLIKVLLLRLGGFEMYRRMQPAVIGVLLGYAVGVTLSLVVDVIWFPGQGHNVHNW